uniref:beta-galactoside alpha-(2,6)-sialyltransferase n=1 Tax=Saccoglossus kowalevskii TaxID=10224 RepID=A0ABM0M1V0_SACKO|nr:PREDICTED: beta-galactoside alpha-2,6-sialyltransferase 2-like [Saccoglossus kowalevskii]
MMGYDTTPFKEMGISKYFPGRNIYEKYNYSRCAVVLSSFYMNETGFGDEIDSHEAVLRLNDAPTVGYEKSVGRKTTIRLLNSKCFNDSTFINDIEAMFVNTTLVTWKSGPYNGNLYKWYQRESVKELLAKYIRWRMVQPSQDFYVINPTSLWDIWDDIMYFNKGKPIKKIVPSSGFTGLLMMLGLCDKVDVYGFGINDVSSCHYYDKPGCNSASKRWHPLQEKAIMAAMHDGPISDLDKHVVTVNGFKHINCNGT